MIDKLDQRLSKLDPRLAIVISALFIFLLAFEGWFLGLRKPYAEYQQISATRATLTSSLSGQEVDDASNLDRLANELLQLSEKLSGELHLQASDDKMAASLMEALDHSASQHKITLSGVKPGKRQMVSVFEEVSFEVTAKGPYLKLCEWMMDFDNTLGSNSAISEFDMKSTNEGKQVILKLKLALYSPIKLNEAMP